MPSVSEPNRLYLFACYNHQTMRIPLRFPVSFFASYTHTGLCLAGIIMFVVGSLSSGWANGTAPSQAPAALVVMASSATVCSGTSTTLTASGCPATGAVRWSTAQTGSVITVVPTQETTYIAICDVTSTSVTTTTAVSSTVTSTTSLVTTVTTTTATGTVSVYAPIAVSTNVKSLVCNGGNDGAITIGSSGGVGGLQYQLNGQAFQSSNIFGALKAGTYAIVVKDGLGCAVLTSAVVKQPDALSASVTVVNTKCVAGSDGALIAVGSGGVGDYRYAILNSTTNPQLSGVFNDLKANTTYTLIVSDQNGCVLYQPVLIGQSTPFVVKVTTKTTRCVGTADGSLSIAVTGGTGTYQYQLGSGPFQAGSLFTGLAATTYSVIVQDGNGCQSQQSVTVVEPAALKLTATSKPVTCLNPNTGSITVTPTGGTGAVMYQVSTGTTPQISNVLGSIAAGNYTVIGTDANGCTSLVSITVNKVDPLKIQASMIPASCCTCPTGAVSLTSTGGTGTGQQFQIIGQAYQTSSQISKLPPNTYRLRAIDDGGCVDSLVTAVTDGNALTLSTGTIKNVSCTGGSDGQASVQIAGGAKPFTYYWLTEKSDTLKTHTASQTTLSEGTYTISVRDSNRCTTTTVFVTLKAVNTTPSKPTVTQLSSSTLVVNQTTGIQWYVRTGSDPGTPVPNATGATLIPFQSGQYYVIITANGCPSAPSDAINFILTALSEPVAPLAARVLPNPILDLLRLEIDQPERSAVQVHLLDVSGRIIRQYQIPAFTGKKQTEWPIEGVATGTYLLKVAADSRQSVLRVVVE